MTLPRRPNTCAAAPLAAPAGSLSRARDAPASSSVPHTGSTPTSNKTSTSTVTSTSTPSGNCSSRAAQIVSRILQPLIPQGQAVALLPPRAHTAGGQAQVLGTAPSLAPASAQGPGPGPVRAVPTLRALCLGFLGRHVEEVVGQLGAHVALLPSDVKACLLCVARWGTACVPGGKVESLCARAGRALPPVVRLQCMPRGWRLVDRHSDPQ